MTEGQEQYAGDPVSEEVTEPETTGLVEIVVTKSQERGDRQIKASYDLGTDLASLVDLYGDAAIFDAASAQIKINIQSFVRRHLKSEDPFYPDEDILKRLAEWKPGVKVSRAKSPVEKLKTMLGKLDSKDLEEVLRGLVAGD